jgi:hypothetical protein
MERRGIDLWLVTTDLFHDAAIYDNEKGRGNEKYSYFECLLGTSLDRSVWENEERSNRETTNAIVRGTIGHETFDNKTMVVSSK